MNGDSLLILHTARISQATISFNYGKILCVWGGTLVPCHAKPTKPKAINLDTLIQYTKYNKYFYIPDAVLHFKTFLSEDCAAENHLINAIAMIP